MTQITYAEGVAPGRNIRPGAGVYRIDVTALDGTRREWCGHNRWSYVAGKVRSAQGLGARHVHVRLA